MNNFENFQQGGKNEQRNEKLKNLLEKISTKLNEQFKKEFESEKPGNLIDNECRLIIKSFMSGRRGGGYTEEEIKEQIKKVDDKEKLEFDVDFSNQKVIDYFKSRGAKNEEEIKMLYNNEKEISNWSIHEKAVMVVLYKFLPKDFVAVRSSDYDDYYNGIDNLIINKKTGEVICTIDDFSALKGSERDRKKREKILRKAKEGGANIMHAISYKDDKLIKPTEFREGYNNTRVKVGMQNIPVFNLRLDGGDVRRLVDAMNNDDIESYGEEEKQILLKILDDFSEQIEFVVNSGINTDVKNKILQFKEVLVNWRTTIK